MKKTIEYIQKTIEKWLQKENPQCFVAGFEYCSYSCDHHDVDMDNFFGWILELEIQCQNYQSLNIKFDIMLWTFKIWDEKNNDNKIKEIIKKLSPKIFNLYKSYKVIQKEIENI